MRVPRLPDFAIERLVDHFRDAQRLLAATSDQLPAVDGIRTRARSIQDSLSRMVIELPLKSVDVRRSRVVRTGARVVGNRERGGLLLTWSFFPMTS